MAYESYEQPMTYMPFESKAIPVKHDDKTVSFKVPYETWRFLKIEALERDTTITKLVSDAVKEKYHLNENWNIVFTLPMAKVRDFTVLFIAKDWKGCKKIKMLQEMNNNELREHFGVTEEQLDAWAAEYESDDWSHMSFGGITQGQPRSTEVVDTPHS